MGRSVEPWGEWGKPRADGRMRGGHVCVAYASRLTALVNAQAVEAFAADPVQDPCYPGRGVRPQRKRQILVTNKYRSHSCGQLRETDIDQTVRLSGWLWRKRNLGKLVFVDLKDHSGVTQCVAEAGSPVASALEDIRPQSVVTVSGRVVRREAPNDALPTGAVEVVADTIEVQNPSLPVPFRLEDDPGTSESFRLQYRFLDLRRDVMRRNIELRCGIISSLRRRMTALGFMEITTPILTASSPEGARDYLVPSRRYPGKFYALPQAPQMFKQLLMTAGFNRYFQIAPCFRDEDARADRSPGEFYQLDLEMAFVEQEDVFATIEPVLHGVFEEFARERPVTQAPFPRIPYREAMLKYGCDKPDLRNPIVAADVATAFEGSGVTFLESAVAEGSKLRGFVIPDGAAQSAGWYKKLEEVVRPHKATFAWFAVGEKDTKGSLKKLVTPELINKLGLKPSDGFVVVAATEDIVDKVVMAVRQKLSDAFEFAAAERFEFCWIVDYPMYERDPDTGALEFSHNPFSMPQGGMAALEESDPLDILAYQYDIVCNGIELSSGAIRNHRPDIMLKAFSLVGYDEQTVERSFGGMLNAFRYGAPPHGGLAPGVDRIVMMLADATDIREVIPFPLNQQAQDLMMGAPSEANPDQLRELGLQLLPSKKKS